MNRLTMCAFVGVLLSSSACAGMPEQTAQEESERAMAINASDEEQLRVAGATVLQEAWAWKTMHQSDWDAIPMAGVAAVNHANLDGLRKAILKALLHANVIYHGVTESRDPFSGSQQLSLTGTPQITLERHISNLHVIVRKGEINGRDVYYGFKVGTQESAQFSKRAFSLASADLVTSKGSLMRLYLQLAEDYRGSDSMRKLAWDWNRCDNLAAQRGFADSYEFDAVTLQTMFCGAHTVCNFKDRIEQNGQWELLSNDDANNHYCTVYNPGVAEAFEPGEIWPADMDSESY
ncbi:MAG: hypothetical protein H6714_00245 [Myxococcales bacterium]|nr:hypothetical protein [Myxococcales bacterium]